MTRRSRRGEHDPWQGETKASSLESLYNTYLDTPTHGEKTFEAQFYPFLKRCTHTHTHAHS